MFFIDALSSTLSSLLGDSNEREPSEKEIMTIKSLRVKIKNTDDKEVIKLLNIMNINTIEKYREIGFQSDNPASDTRAAGVLGIEQLLYFFKNRKNESHNIIQKRKNRDNGNNYPVAAIGMNITHFLATEFKIVDQFGRYPEINKINTNYYQFLDNTTTTDNNTTNNDSCECNKYHELYCESFLLLDYLFEKKGIEDKEDEVTEDNTNTTNTTNNSDNSDSNTNNCNGKYMDMPAVLATFKTTFQKLVNQSGGSLEEFKRLRTEITA